MRYQGRLNSLRSRWDRLCAQLPEFTQLRRYLPIVLIGTGMVLLLYVSLAYTSMGLQQRRLAREWQRQQQAPPVQRVADDGLIRISAQRVGLDAIVMEGTGRRALLLGPGHLPGTPEPGQPGNAVITGHRDTFFRHLHELNKGDIVTVQRAGQTYEYEVIGKKIVNPEDLSVLQPSTEERLTLITCYPTYYIGPAPDRLVVFTRLVPGPKEATAVNQAQVGRQ